MRSIKKLRAQQLIEFLLVVPFMMIILGIITEYAYALNVNLSLYNGLRTVTSTIYSEIKPGMSKTDIHDFVKERLENYLVANNIPLSSANNLKVDIITNSDSAAFLVSYTYLSAFTLPNVYFHVLPAKFEFSAVSVVPAAFLKPNNYPSDINSLTLDKIWGTPATFNDSPPAYALDAFMPLEKGIMNATLAGNADTSHIAFLVPVNSLNYGPFASDTPYYVLNWNMTPVGGLSYAHVANFENNKVYECGKELDDEFGNFIKMYCDQTGSSATGLVSGYWNVIAIDKQDFSTPYNTGDLLSTWLTKGGAAFAGKVVDADDGALRRIIGLSNFNSSGAAVINGNYDNLDVSTYNPTASLGKKYKIQSQGSYIFVHGNDSFPHTPIGGSGKVRFD